MPGSDANAAASNPQLEALRRMARAPAYNRWLIERALEHVRGRVLDLGAGTGTLTRLAADAADEVVAVEPDGDLVPVLRARVADKPNVTIVQAAAESLDALPYAGFDSIVCLNVLEHIDDDEAALKVIRRVVVPGGRLVLLVPAHPFLYGEIDRTVSHHRRYAVREFEALLERSQFEVEDLRLVNPLGAIGWFLASRVLKRTHVPEAPLAVYDRLVPLLRALDRPRLPFGLSIWAVARPGSSA